MDWEIENVGMQEATMDDSDVYVVINRQESEHVHKGIWGTILRVRVDVMRSGDNMPIRSFIGRANDVRKAVIGFICRYTHSISYEHASYIGWEICRAESDPGFVQD